MMGIEVDTRSAEAVECDELMEALTERFEETLIAPTRHRIQAHLEACTACRAFVEKMQLALVDPAPPEDPVDPDGWDARAVKH
jgi:predicted anti-sigma-YlaC factor YlaD